LTIEIISFSGRMSRLCREKSCCKLHAVVVAREYAAATLPRRLASFNVAFRATRTFSAIARDDMLLTSSSRKALMRGVVSLASFSPPRRGMMNYLPISLDGRPLTAFALDIADPIVGGLRDRDAPAGCRVDAVAG
jgi:hypothetical protein